MLQVARFSVFFHDSSLTGCSVLGILQARILQRIAILFLRDFPDPGIKPGSPAYIIYICIYVEMEYIYHIFFIHLSINGHLDCFSILAIVNKTLINMECYISSAFYFYFLWTLSRAVARMW